MEKVRLYEDDRLPIFHTTSDIGRDLPRDIPIYGSNDSLTPNTRNIDEFGDKEEIAQRTLDGKTVYRLQSGQFLIIIGEAVNAYNEILLRQILGAEFPILPVLEYGKLTDGRFYILEPGIPKERLGLSRDLASLVFVLTKVFPVLSLIRKQEFEIEGNRYRIVPRDIKNDTIVALKGGFFCKGFRPLGYYQSR